MKICEAYVSLKCRKKKIKKKHEICEFFKSVDSSNSTAAQCSMLIVSTQKLTVLCRKMNEYNEYNDKTTSYILLIEFLKQYISRIIFECNASSAFFTPSMLSEKQTSC